MKTYTLQNIDSLNTYMDMTIEAKNALNSGSETEILFARSGMPNDVEPPVFMFFPNAKRGAACCRGYSGWTDCDSIKDLQDRYENYDDRWIN